MPSVNWDEPSSGLVSDADPALTLQNTQGGSLVAESSGVAVAAKSVNAEAVRAETDHTLAGRFSSDTSIALIASAPKSIAGIAVNQVGNIAALAGASNVDPAAPQNSQGIGVLGITDRAQAIGVAGFATGTRSLGVLGQANTGVGVRGVGPNGGVEGTATGAAGVSGFTSSNSAPGVYGFGPGEAGAGVRGEGLAGPGVDAHSSAGPGVRALSDQAHGVVAESKAANAAGVLARNDQSSGVGVDGYSQNGTAVRGISSKGVAVFADTLSGRGVDASTFSQDEPAIYALAPASPALEAGSILAEGVSALGKTGVRGMTLAAPDPSDIKIGSGVSGQAISGYGVSGVSLTGYGVLGVGSAALGAWAGAFDGNVQVNGIIFKLASLFSIDHPLDPERKVLNHAAVEAPEYKTFYDGVVTLDAKGHARVRLPKWFDPLNGDLRYQLTAIGTPAPNLHVEREVSDGVFSIAGGAPGQKVSWQITGVRRDAWAQAHPLAVEQSKRSLGLRLGSADTAVLERQAAELQRKAASLETAGAERERAAKNRTPPEPLDAPPVPEPPAIGAAVREIADQVRATIDRLTER